VNDFTIYMEIFDRDKSCCCTVKVIVDYGDLENLQLIKPF